MLDELCDRLFVCGTWLWAWIHFDFIRHFVSAAILTRGVWFIQKMETKYIFLCSVCAHFNEQAERVGDRCWTCEDPMRGFKYLREKYVTIQSKTMINKQINTLAACAKQWDQVETNHWINLIENAEARNTKYKQNKQKQNISIYLIIT